MDMDALPDRLEQCIRDRADVQAASLLSMPAGVVASSERVRC